jgi:hypothetical protein
MTTKAATVSGVVATTGSDDLCAPEPGVFS